jgi:hypothetical protein
VDSKLVRSPANSEEKNMRKQWVALLSMLGLANAAMPVRSQVLKGSSQSKTAHNNKVKAVNGSNAVQKTGGSSKLNLEQQTLRQQNNGVGGGKQADTMTPSAYCNKGNTGKANNQLTPPPPGGNAVTKGSNNQKVTKTPPNYAVTKGSANAVTKGSANAVTKGSANAVTKGSANAVTKGSANAVTKGSAVQTTAAAGPH